MLDNRQVRVEGVFGEARVAATKVLGSEVVLGLEPSGQESATKRRIRHKGDSKLVASWDHIMDKVLSPKRQLALNSGYGMHLVGAPDGFGGSFT
jgi:hypothetical protein